MCEGDAVGDLRERGTVTVSAHDVARELRQRIPDLDRLKLHKLLYYCQSWHLTWSGRPLFSEAIEAWIYGPVVASLWADERYERPRPAPQPLAQDELATLNYVAERYGRLSGPDLSRRAHDEAPWRDLSENEAAFARGASAEITHDALRRWFTEDADYRSHKQRVDELRQRGDVYSFRPLERSESLMRSVARAAAGEQVRDTRPL